MTVRRKIFLILVGSVTLIFAAIFLMTRLILEKGVARQERLLISGDAERVLQALNNELATLDRFVNDYSTWDDTYAFIHNPSPAYLESNIVATTFQNGQICAMIFLDETGRVVHQAAYDEATESMVPPQDGLTEFLSPGRPLLRFADLKSGVKGFVVLKDEVFLAASRPIITSNGEGPVRGTLAIFKRFDSARVDYFSQIVNLPLVLKKFGSAETREDFASARTGTGTIPAEIVRFLDGRRVEGDALFRDLEGRPAFILSFIIERVFRAQYLRTQNIFYLAIGILALICFFVIMGVFDRLVARRMSHLARFVKQTEASGNLGQRVFMKGADEPALLAKSINSLLDSLDRHVRRIQAVEDAVRRSEIKYRTLFEASTDPIFLGALDGRTLDCNQSATALLGYTKEELLRMNVSDIVPSTIRSSVPDAIHALADKKGLVVEAETLAKSGEVIPVEFSIRLAQIGEEELAVTYIRDLRARRKAERAQAAVFDIATAAATAANLGELYGLIHAKVTALIPTKNFHIAVLEDAKEQLTYPYFVDEIQPPPPPRALGRGLTEYMLRRGEPMLATSERIGELRRQGEIELEGTVPMDWLGVPLRSEGKTIGVMAVQSYAEHRRFGEEDKALLAFMSSQVAMAIDRVRARDRIKASLREKDVLLREVHHRVKNNMQVISSLFNLTAGEIQDSAALNVLRECQARIRSMALVHEKLYQSRDLARIDFSDYVETLILHLVNFWKAAQDKIRLVTDVEAVTLDINTAIPCGLIINELVSNALEHAFPDGRKGAVRVSLRPTEQAAYELVVKDDGVGLPPDLDPAQTESLGLQLVNLLVHQLDGQVSVSRNAGTQFTISFREMRFKARG